MKYLILFLCMTMVYSDCSCSCMDRETLGRSTWYLLHEIPKHADPEYEPAFDLMLRTLAVLYPCPECRAHIQEYLDSHRVQMTEKWMCEFHNDVNKRLNKTLVPCSSY